MIRETPATRRPDRESRLLRKLVHILLHLFPEDLPGMTRDDIEETFFDHYRARTVAEAEAEGGGGATSGWGPRRSRVRFLAREIWSLARHGLSERRERLGVARPFMGFTDDVRFATRALLKHRAFSLGAILMLGLGIGVNTATFSMATGMSRIVQRLQDPDALVFLWGVEENRDRAAVSAPDYFAWRDQSTVFEDMAVYTQRSPYLTGDGEPLRIREVQTSANLLPLLGLGAEIGRLHGLGDEAASAPAVAVLTWRLWQDRYGGTEDVLGRILLLNEVPHTIIGVLPRQADIEVLWREAGVFSPLLLSPGSSDWTQRSYRVVGRLAEGATAEQAQAQVNAIARRLAESQPETNARVRARVEPFRDMFFSAEDKLAVGGLLLAVVAVLLIACVNLANLFLAKGTARQGEVAIRLAVGASRGRMIRQLLSESVLLALAGGAVGMVLGRWGLDLFLASMPTPPFLLDEAGLDGALLTYALAVSLAAALSFGLAPALLASRVSLSESVKESGKSGGRGRKRMRNGILVAQLALTVPLVLTCAVSFMNLRALQSIDFGFPVEGLLTAQVELPAFRYPEESDQGRFYQDLVEAVREIPGVTGASAGARVPIGAGLGSAYSPLVVEGREGVDGASRGPQAYQPVTPTFFQTLRVPLRAGRSFTREDGPGQPTVGIVNEAFARLYWPGEDPLGKRLLPESDPEHLYPGAKPAVTDPVTVVGVVADHGATFYGEPPRAQLYLPQFQHPLTSLRLVVRTGGDPLLLVPAVREAFQRLDPTVPLSGFRTGETMVDDWLSESRSIGVMLGIFAVLALGLSIIGLYGMVAYSVAQRTFEIGVRMVLGAGRRAIRVSVMRSFMVLAGIGLVIGVAISAAVGIVARSFLVLLQVSYVPTVLGVTGLLMGAVVVAAFVPARRATTIQPVVALKSE
ncbi:ABC transporter permease [Gemmatimonadota bacterium]